MKDKMKEKNGFSLFETLIVVAVFAIISILATQSLVLSLRGTNKSATENDLKQDLDFAIGLIEKQVRNADSIDTLNSTSTNLIYYHGSTQLQYQCSSERLFGNNIDDLTLRAITGQETRILDCNFVYTPSTATTPASVDVTINAESRKFAGTAEGARVTVRTHIMLRTY